MNRLNGWFGAGGVRNIDDCCTTWDANSVRYIAVSYDNGNDSNAGFSDVSMAAAGSVAIRTLTALRALIPSIGRGRRLAIAIETRAGGANYLKPDGVTQDSLILEGISGYRKLLVRGTITDVSAGSVAFSNSAADKLMAGFIRASGTNANGYNVATLNSNRDFTIQLAGGGADRHDAERVAYSLFVNHADRGTSQPNADAVGDERGQPRAAR